MEVEEGMKIARLHLRFDVCFIVVQGGKRKPRVLGRSPLVSRVDSPACRKRSGQFRRTTRVSAGCGREALIATISTSTRVSAKVIE